VHERIVVCQSDLEGVILDAQAELCDSHLCVPAERRVSGSGGIEAVVNTAQALFQVEDMVD